MDGLQIFKPFILLIYPNRPKEITWLCLRIQGQTPSKISICFFSSHLPTGFVWQFRGKPPNPMVYHFPYHNCYLEGYSTFSDTHTHILSWKSEHSPNFIIRKPLTDSSPKLAPSGNQAWLAGQSLIFRWCSYISSEALGRFSFHSIAIYPFCIWDFPIWRFPIHGGTPHSSSIYHHISRDSNHFHHVLSHM